MHKVPTPCGGGAPYEQLVACYAEWIISGNNYYNLELRSGTVREYLEAVNDLFERQNFLAPVNFGSAQNLPALLYRDYKTWEDEPNRRSPFTVDMILEMMSQAKEAGPDSFEASLVDWVLVGRYVGQRCGEFAQTTQLKEDYHVTPRGKKILKAFTRGDIRFFNDQGRLILNPKEGEGKAIAFTTTWKVQKNRRNGQEAEWAADPQNPTWCPCEAMIRIVNRAKRLKVSTKKPLAVWKDGKGNVKYITGAKAAIFFKAIAKKLYPYMTEKELSRFTMHSIRVLAAVLLHEAGKDAEFLKVRLRWLSDSYRLYLRNTKALAAQHREAIGAFSAHIPDSVEYGVEVDAAMGEYLDA